MDLRSKFSLQLGEKIAMDLEVVQRARLERAKAECSVNVR
jgi:hypothetical protein